LEHALTGLAPAGKLDFQHVPALLARMHACDVSSPQPMGALVELDLSAVQWVEPIGICLLTAWLRSRICSGGQLRLNHRPDTASNWSPDSYLETIGFYSFCNGEGSPDVGGRGHSYMWTTLHDVKGVEPTALSIVRLIEANMQITQAARNALLTAFSEVLENVFRHAQCDWCALGLQVYPTTGRLKFAVADHGCGIRTSLGLNPTLAVPRSDAAAIRLALTKSTSSSPQGTGIGLFITHQIVSQNQGALYILSGNGDYYSRKEGTHYPDARFAGTVLSLELDTTRLLDTRPIYDAHFPSIDDTGGDDFAFFR